MKILVLNSGSSSIKFQLFDAKANDSLVSGIIEQIGEKISHAKIKFEGKELERTISIPNHKIGLEIMISLLI